MSQDLTPTTSRRNLLRAGGVGVAGAFALAACGNDRPKAGVSGTPAPSTSVPPTVPVTTPSATALENDAIQIHTLRSFELLVADIYAEYGPRLTDTEMRTAAARFEADHKAAAAELTAGISKDDVVDPGTPNEYLQENLVDPIVSQLVDDVAILDFFHDLESGLAATYINSVGIFTSAEWRQKAMTFGGADARRVTVLANGGEGGAPTAPTFPATDLIPGDAFLGPKKEEEPAS